MSPAKTETKNAPNPTADDKPTLMLLDGNSLAFRAFYALPAENFKTQGGLTTNAVYLFILQKKAAFLKDGPYNIP